MSVNVDAVVSNVMGLDAAIFNADKNGIDARIQGIIQQLDGLNPDFKSDVAKIYEATDVQHLEIHHTPELRFRDEKSVLKMEQDIISVLAKAMPGLDIKSKIDQQKALEAELQRAAKTGIPENMEKFLKECASLKTPPAFLTDAVWIKALKNFAAKNAELKRNVYKRDHDLILKLTTKFLEALCEVQ